MKQVTEAEKAFNDARTAYVDLRDRYLSQNLLPAMRKRIGFCFVYRNCFSCPQSEADYWPMYARVVGVTDDGRYELLTVQRCSNGSIEISTTFRQATEEGMLPEDYRAISASTFKKATELILQEAQRRIKE